MIRANVFTLFSYLYISFHWGNREEACGAPPGNKNQQKSGSSSGTGNYTAAAFCAEKIWGPFLIWFVVVHHLVGEGSIHGYFADQAEPGDRQYYAGPQFARISPDPGTTDRPPVV
jgi:hypothetical protein